MGAVEDNNVTSITYRHEDVSVYVCTYMHMHVKARGPLPFLEVLSTLFFKIVRRMSHDPELAK